MRRIFWRGMIAGSVLGALLSVMRHPKTRASGLPGLRNSFRRMYSRRASDRVFRGVTRTVGGIIRKRIGS